MKTECEIPAKIIKLKSKIKKFKAELKKKRNIFNWDVDDRSEEFLTDKIKAHKKHIKALKWVLNGAVDNDLEGSALEEGHIGFNFEH